MNERIKELALQANPASKEIYESDSWQFNCAAWSAKELEKFAELIVRECAKIAYQNDIAKFTKDGYRIGLDIQKHFGVEE